MVSIGKHFPPAHGFEPLALSRWCCFEKLWTLSDVGSSSFEVQNPIPFPVLDLLPGLPRCEQTAAHSPAGSL